MNGRAGERVGALHAAGLAPLDATGGFDSKQQPVWVRAVGRRTGEDVAVSQARGRLDSVVPVALGPYLGTAGRDDRRPLAADQECTAVRDPDRVVDSARAVGIAPRQPAICGQGGHEPPRAILKGALGAGDEVSAVVEFDRRRERGATVPLQRPDPLDAVGVVDLRREGVVAAVPGAELSDEQVAPRFGSHPTEGRSVLRSGGVGPGPRAVLVPLYRRAGRGGDPGGQEPRDERPDHEPRRRAASRTEPGRQPRN